MGYKQHKDTPPMEREINYLLYDLCVIYGFCIPPEDSERISLLKHLNAKEFARSVLIAEGMNPDYEHKWAKMISNKFIERFGSEDIYKKTFVDRIR